MDQFEMLQKILSGQIDFLKPEQKKSDRVLKSTGIEQAIYEELKGKSECLSACAERGSEKLPSFRGLIQDIYQSVYGLVPRYADTCDVSALAMQFNRPILEELMADEQYAAIKSVCEGKELPAIRATEEFAEKLETQLEDLMKKITGCAEASDVPEQLRKAQEELARQLDDLCKVHQNAAKEQRGHLEKRMVQTANRILSKKEQCAMYENMLYGRIREQKQAIRSVVSRSAESARQQAEMTYRCIMAWGDAENGMQKNQMNTQVLAQCAASQKLRMIAKCLGRYKEMLSTKRLDGYRYGNGEKYDIEYGNRITHAMTADLALLAQPTMLPLFVRKYRNKQLRQYRKREPVYRGRGNIIVCLDESSSTYGDNNAYGMAIAMVLYEICRIHCTNFALVHFASEVKTHYFPVDTRPTQNELLRCAKTFLGGGTNFDKAICEAVRLASETKMQKPDIVFITDGMCDVSEETQTMLRAFKASFGTRLTGILLDQGSCFPFSLQKFADRVYRSSELAQDVIMEKLIEERV